MDDSGIFENFLDTNTLESNFINVKLEPQSPPSYFSNDHYSTLGGGNIGNSGNIINNNHNNINNNNNMININNNNGHNINNNIMKHNINNVGFLSSSSIIPTSISDTMGISSMVINNNNNNTNNNIGSSNSSTPIINSISTTTTGNNSSSSTSSTVAESQQLYNSPVPFSQQFQYSYPTSQHSSTSTSISNSPLGVQISSSSNLVPTNNISGDLTNICGDNISPITPIINSVHHQLINHLHQQNQTTPNIFFPTSLPLPLPQPQPQTNISNLNNINFPQQLPSNNSNSNNNNNSLRHQQNISRSMYLNPNLDQQQQQQQQQQQNTNITTPNFESSQQQQILQQGLNINSTTPDLNSTSTANGTTTTTLNSSPRMIVGDLDIIIEQQPPSDVRTRTPNDRRTFNTVIRVVGDLVKNQVGGVLVQLAYANTSTTDRPSQFILGGNKIGIIGKDGKVAFDSLSMTEASTKHRENEFCLEYVLISDDNRIYTTPGNGLSFIKRSRAFYAYSNQKVLSRRRNITLRTLSSNRGTSLGGDQMHVVGAPFIRCNSLRCIFHTPHGDIPATNIELYSESVLFFTLPPYPTPPNFTAQEGTELPVQVVITNDGRNYSNPLAFTYIYEGNHGTKRLRSRF